MQSKVDLVVLVRSPELGKVKTRLAADIGPRSALELYLHLLNHTLEAAWQSSFNVHVFCQGDLNIHSVFWRSEFRLYQQNGSDLGEIMLNALSLVSSPAQPFLLIGSDCPDISAEILQKAAAILLENKDTAVLGPAYDGGYYLLGANRIYPNLFLDMSWSHSQVLQITVNRLQNEHIKVCLLDKLMDIDVLEDLQFFLYSDKSNIINNYFTPVDFGLAK